MKNILSALVFLLASQQVLAQQPFQTFDMIVTDPAGVVAAMNKLQASPTGQQSTARVILNQYLANGESLATHQILVVYPSTEEMDANIARNALSPDWAEFLAEMQEVATVEAEGVGQILAVGGDINSSVATGGRSDEHVLSDVGLRPCCICKCMERFYKCQRGHWCYFISIQCDRIRF